MRRTLPGGRGGQGAGRGRQVCEGVLEGVGVDVVEDQAVGGVQESRVDSAQVGGASGRLPTRPRSSSPHSGATRRTFRARPLARATGRRILLIEDAAT
ncbi:hypothetical protein HEP84_49915 [Streptomyces sp. RLB1-33]|nr:hypothetical protein [Streptomyces sp. RLB1-33]QIY75895.1 hypothetical protein HEP84_49915 [Streptomyces sp. RLB1-33]